MGGKRNSALFVANWDSDAGYAWWLMESFWVYLANNLNAEFECLLAYPTVSVIPETINNAPITIKKWDFNNTSFFVALSHLNNLRNNNVKLIYFTDRPGWHWSYLFFRLAGVKKIIVHDHTPGTRSSVTGIKQYFKWLVHRIPFINADGVIAVTEYVQQRHMFVNKIPVERCHLARNGIKDINDISSVDLNAKFGISESRKIIVMTGRANTYKRIDFILLCMNRLVNDFNRKDVHFLFCGDGPELNNLKDMVSKFNLDPYVSMPGNCSDIPGILQSCSIAIHPSKGEVGYSLSILEYMQAGLAVVVPDNPSVCGATIDGVTGLIYRENDELFACEIINKLLDNSELANKIGANAKKAVVKKYNLSLTHSQLLKSVQKVCGLSESSI